MSQDNAYPSRNPADEGELLGAFREVFGKMLQNVDGMLPARVINYDRTTNRVQVQPLIMVVTTVGQQVSRGAIASIPVLNMGGGNWLLSYPLNTGDLGWILASDRDISQFLQGYSESQPQSYRKKNFADSLFIPHVMTGYTIASEDTNNAVIQSKDGTIKISLGTSKIKISAPEVEIDTPTINMTASTVINMTAPNINMNASAQITNTTPLNRTVGNINASGTITPLVP